MLVGFYHNANNVHFVSIQNNVINFILNVFLCSTLYYYEKIYIIFSLFMRM